MFFKYTWNVNKDKPLSGSFKKIKIIEVGQNIFSD